MFDPVRITLATPPVTPGRVATKVTVLSPQFEIGANSDVWDEALQGASAPLTSDSRSAALRGVPEAGKVWDKGRNWTTVVLEVVPGTLPGSSAEGGDGNPNTETDDEDVLAVAASRQDEDVLEIPVFVHMDWDTDAQLDQQNVGKGSKPDDKVTRELAYWMVLGVGRIQPSL
jgi:dynactin-4